MKARLDELRSKAIVELDSIDTPGELEAWRIRYLGRKSALTEVLRGCRDIEEQYKEFCEQRDAAEGEEKGTNYAQGVNMEFYIEGLSWHDVSLALRRLEKECDESSEGC